MLCDLIGNSQGHRSVSSKTVTCVNPSETKLIYLFISYLFNCFQNLAAISHPIRSKTKTNCDSLRCVLTHMVPTTQVCFDHKS